MLKSQDETMEAFAKKIGYQNLVYSISGFGSAFAFLMSLLMWREIGTAIIQGIFGWATIIYWALFQPQLSITINRLADAILNIAK